MKLAIAHLESVSPMMFGRKYDRDVPKLDKELHDAYDQRTWRNRLHISKDGFATIPPLMIKNATCNGAKRCNIKIPGQRNATFTKNFLSGILVLDPIVLPYHVDKIRGLVLSVPSDGTKGGTRRVERTFPIIDEWEGEAIFHILDEIITEDVFRYVLEQTGAFVGFGAMRVQNGGIAGRFKVNKLEWA